MIEQALQGRRPYLWNLLLTPNRVLSGVCAMALELGVAAETARTLITRFRLRPPGPDTVGWPWAVAIHTFGRFRVELGGEPLQFGHKAQRKPLEPKNGS